MFASCLQCVGTSCRPPFKSFLGSFFLRLAALAGANGEPGLMLMLNISKKVVLDEKIWCTHVHYFKQKLVALLIDSIALIRNYHL